MNDQPLTVKQAAERLGITVNRVQAMCRKGRLPARKFGREWMIKASDLKIVENRKAGRPRKKPEGAY